MPTFKGFGHHLLLAYCGNTREPRAGMLRKAIAGPNTVADHLDLLGEAERGRPRFWRARLR
jgi:hypothetical protein